MRKLDDIEVVASVCGLVDDMSSNDIQDSDLKRSLVFIDYKNIIKASKEIWYDNGMINRIEPESEKVELLVNWLQTIDNKKLDKMELELSNLSDGDLFTLCCGEEYEQDRLSSKELNEFLEMIFNEEYEIRSGDMVEINSYKQTIQLCGRESQKFIGDLMYVVSIEGDVISGFDYNFVGKNDVKLVEKGNKNE